MLTLFHHIVEVVTGGKIASAVTEAHFKQTQLGGTFHFLLDQCCIFYRTVSLWTTPLCVCLETWHTLYDTH